MHNQYEISVIIPVYGAEQFIERSLRSLWDSPNSISTEYILVDDCSPDHSIEIAKKLLQNYPHIKGQIKIISHEENEGSAIARQTGLNAATGKYIIYIDSDDFCEPYMLEKLYTKAEQEHADIVICDFIYEYQNYFQYESQRPISLNSRECIIQLLEGSLQGFCWNKLFRRTIFIEDFFYIKGLNVWEDLYMCCKAFSKTNKIAYLDEAFVHYVKYNINSLTASTTKNRKLVNQTTSIISLIEKELHKKGLIDTRIYKALIICKLHAKMPLILSSDKKDNILWLETFPETNNYIWQDIYTDKAHRIAFLLGRYRCFILKNAILDAGRTFRKLIIALKHSKPLITFILLILLTACSKQNKDVPTREEAIIIETPALKAFGREWSQKEFIISTFGGVPFDNVPGEEKYYPEAIANLKDAGFNLIETPWQKSINTLAILSECEKQGGIKVIAQDMDLLGGFAHLYSRPYNQKSIDKFLQTYGSFNSLGGIYIWDEPMTKDFDNVLQNTDTFENLRPDLLGFTVILQSYSPWYNWENSSEIPYDQYVRQYVEKVNPPILCSDYYPFKYPITPQQFYSSNYWKDMSYLRKIALEYDIPHWFYYQGRDPDESDLILTAEQIAVQVWSSIMYGVKGLSSFTAYTSVIDEQGGKGRLFESTKQLNKQIKALSSILLSLNSEVIFHGGGGGGGLTILFPKRVK